MAETDDKVLVAMSGGVDSSVAAALLVRRGMEVVGVTLRLRYCDDPAARGSCCDAQAEGSARAVAERLGIEHRVVGAEQAFEDEVLRRAWEEYARGRTPNPCVVCNERIKFGWLGRVAEEMGARWVATGHHARVDHSDSASDSVVRHTGSASASRGLPQPILRRGADRDKDQSYFLFQLSDDQLRRTLFPVGDLTKAQVREVARELGLPSAERAESQDACFALQDGTFADALAELLGAEARPGRIVDPRGRELGHHEGIHRFTVGQRKGLGVALGRPAYVVAIDAASGDVMVTTEPDDLLSDGLRVTDVRWRRKGPAAGEVIRAQVQIRYRAAPARARVKALDGGRAEVAFDEPQRAITPGQAAVVYDGDVVIGGGWIE